MNGKVDPKIYGLPPRTVLIEKNSKELVLIMDRKSRIIMKDAQAIFKKVNKIKEKAPDALISLETTAPVCSKSIKFLKDNGIKIFQGTL